MRINAAVNGRMRKKKWKTKIETKNLGTEFKERNIVEWNKSRRKICPVNNGKLNSGALFGKVEDIFYENELGKVIFQS